MSGKDHRLLVKALNKLVKHERWCKIPKAKGIVIEMSFTKSGSIKLIIQTNKDEISFFVLKRNKNLFEEALKIQKGDIINVALRTQLGKQYCVKLTRNKERRLNEWF